MRKYAVLAVLVIGFVLTFAFGSKADQNQDVKPYQFAEVPLSYHSQNAKVFKMVYQGCEIYVVENEALGHEAASVAIATGRGCK